MLKFLQVVLVGVCLYTESAESGSPYSNPNCAPGRTAIVHLFEWKWTDVKAECERFLGPYGYCGVQVSPANENAIITTPNRPWWERYQPVSYKMVTRSGSKAEFNDMVTTCNKHGVRIYVDSVINHMTGGMSGTGTAGSNFDGNTCAYPGVPYTQKDCNGIDLCHTSDGAINDYNDPTELRNCNLFGLADLRLGGNYVRGKIAGYMNKLIDMGVAGFRIDAAKHMWPGDLQILFAQLHDLLGADFGPGKRPFIYQEIIQLEREESVKMTEYTVTGMVTNFMYGQELADVFLRNSENASSLKFLPNTEGNADDVLVFLSNHDNQRGHGSGKDVITFREAREYKTGTAYMLAYPYGFPRIMSSYMWNRTVDANGQDANDWQGPPHNPDMSTMDVPINADLTCGGGWVCEHRWPAVYRMVAFANVVAGTPISRYTWVTITDNQIAFSRGDKGFIAIVTDGSRLVQTISTNLPSGTYCDVISGDIVNDTCTGKAIHLDAYGNAHLNVNGASEFPLIAIHIGAKIGSPKQVTTPFV